MHIHTVLTSGATGQRSAYYGQGIGPIHLDQVQCNGNETNLLDCPSSPLGQHNCFHLEDAGVSCSAGEAALPPLTMLFNYVVLWFHQCAMMEISD